MSEGFDVNSFMKADFKPRMAEVPVPALRQFFPPDEEGNVLPVWKVRGLTGAEIAKTNEVASRNEKLTAVIDAFGEISKKDMTDSLKESLGLGSETPADLSKRLEQVVLGSVEPVITLETAVKLATVMPIEFYAISNKILELTGKGHTAEGKPKPSGKKQE